MGVEAKRLQTPLSKLRKGKLVEHEIHKMSTLSIHSLIIKISKSELSSEK